MHTLLTLLVLGLLTLPGSPFNIGISIQVRPSCKTTEECYGKYIRFDLRPLREGKGRPYKKACSEHEACKCTLLPVSLCAHEVYTNFENRSLRVEDCPTSLQCHYLRFNNCEKDSVCPLTSFNFSILTVCMILSIANLCFLHHLWSIVNVLRTRICS